MENELKVSVNASAMDVSYISIVTSSAGFRTRHKGHVPRGLHKTGPPQKQTFVYIFRMYVIFITTFASCIIIALFILK